ncbi:MAG: cheY40H-3 [Holophagaceae bacterium]|nr:cheY40H-3 [Holophagaceae bacterium]
MTEAAKANLQQVLHKWVEDHHLALKAQMDTVLAEGLDRYKNDNSFITNLLNTLPPPSVANPVEEHLGNGLDLLESAQSQGEVLKRLLETIQPFAERCALFVVKQGIASLYTSRGFETEAPRPGSPVVPPSELDALLQGRIHRLDQPGPAYEALLRPLSRFEASTVFILPLKLRRKTVAVLLADSGLCPTLDHPNAIRVLVHTAEACISHLAGIKDEDRSGPPEANPSSMTQQIPDPITETVPPLPSVDPKVRANAERSARVLVGDIELYFPAKVEQGRSSGNLYGLLRDELDRSRASFVERYGEDLERHHRIFLSTVVQQLCGGDSLKLGSAPWI